MPSLALLVLAATITTEPIDVADYGVSPGAEDQREALEALFERRAGEPVLALRFPPGVYRIGGEALKDKDPDDEGPLFDAHFTFRGRREVTITGPGATFLFTDVDKGGFAFEDCENVELQGFRIDYSRPPFSTGEVIGGGERFFDIRIDGGFPIGDPPPRVMAFNRYDPDTRAPMPTPGAVCGYFETEEVALLEPQVLRVRYRGGWQVPEGAVLVLHHRVYGHDGFRFRNCGRVLAEEVTIHTCPGMGFHADGCGDVTLRRCAVKPPDGPNRRYLSSTADGSHFVNCRGVMTLEDCQFINTGDDANNTYGIFFNVVSRDGRRLVLNHRYPFLFPADLRPGDVLALCDPETMLPEAHAAVEEAAVRHDDLTYAVTLNAGVPERVVPGYKAANLDALPKLRVTGCTVRNTRGRGFLASTRDVVIANNRCENLQNGGVLVLPDLSDFTASGPVRNLVIRDNVLRDNNRGWGPCMGEISVGALLPGWTMGAAGVNRNVVIERNEIVNTGHSWLWLSSTDGAVIRDNVVRGACVNPSTNYGYAAVYLQACRDVLFEQNRLAWDRGGDDAFSIVEMDERTDENSVVFAGNEGYGQGR